MSTTRTKDLEQTALWFHALADETRLRIIEHLLEGEQCVCDLTDFLQTGQSRLSFHLKTLKDAGLLQDRREGRWIYYSLNAETVEAIGQWLTTLKGTRAKSRPAAPCCD